MYCNTDCFIKWHSIHILQNVFFLNPQKWTNLQFKTLGLNQFYSIKISIHVPDSCFVDSTVFPFSASFYNVKLNELDKIGFYYKTRHDMAKNNGTGINEYILYLCRFFIVCLYMYCHWKFFQVSLLLVYLCIQGIPEQLGTGKIARLIAVFPSYFVFKNENVKVKVKYGFVLYLGLSVVVIAQTENFRIFFIGKGSFYLTLGKARKNPALLL